MTPATPPHPPTTFSRKSQQNLYYSKEEEKVAQGIKNFKFRNAAVAELWAETFAISQKVATFCGPANGARKRRFLKNYFSAKILRQIRECTRGANGARIGAECSVLAQTAGKALKTANTFSNLQVRFSVARRSRIPLGIP